MTDEVNEMSDGSRGSHADAWAVEHGGSIVHVAIRAYDAQEWAGGGPCDVVPLYRSPTLTEGDRRAIRFFLEKHRKIQKQGENYCCIEASQHADAIQRLLERLA